MNYGHTVGELHLLNEFGEDWAQPNGLIIRPHFIADQYSTSLTIQRNLAIKCKLEFYNEINKILDNENLVSSLSGYLMFDVDLTVLRPADNMDVHAMLFSGQICKIIELIDDENSIAKVAKRLKPIIQAIRVHINNRVPVKGITIFSCKTRQPTSITDPDNLILYKDELGKLFLDFSQASRISSTVTEEVKTALAKMLQISFLEQCYPETKEKATYLAAQKLFMQKPDEKVREFTQIDFNLIKLTEVQNGIKNDLLAGSTLVRGGYGIGKSVAIVAAIKDSIEQYKMSVNDSKSKQTDFKILFLSAQGLLSDTNLMLSPFLLTIKKWVREACGNIGYDNDLQILNYTQFLDRNIDFALQSKSVGKGDIIFCSYLLKMEDFQILKTKPGLLNKFNIIAVEETHVLDSSMITDFVTCFEKAITTNKRNSKLWITSNTEDLDLTLRGFIASPKPHLKQENLRNVPAVAKLAEAVNANIGPERYPSTALPMSSVKCQIGVTYEFEFNDEKRLKKIVEEAKNWKQWLSKSSLLLIDCEDSGLHEQLKTEGIFFKLYRDIDNYDTGEPLLLQRSDPVEAVLAGTEWHVLIVHIKSDTINSIKVVKLFNKRIISRATTKVIIFSDRGFEVSEEEIDMRIEFRDSFNPENVERTGAKDLDTHHSLVG